MLPSEPIWTSVPRLSSGEFITPSPKEPPVLPPRTPGKSSCWEATEATDVHLGSGAAQGNAQAPGKTRIVERV